MTKLRYTTSLIRGGFILAVALFALQPSWSLAQGRDAERVFLRSLFERVEFYLFANRAHSEGLLWCAEQMALNRHLAEPNQTPAQFNRHYLGKSGRSSKRIECSVVLKEAVVEPILDVYPQVRKKLALIAPGVVEDNSEITESPHAEIGLQIQRNIQHQLMNDSWIKKDLGRLPPLSEPEILEVMDEFRQNTEKYCEEFVASDQWLSATTQPNLLSSSPINPDSFCQSQILDSPILESEFAGHHELDDLARQFRRWVHIVKRPEMRRQAKREYMELLWDLPIVAFVSDLEDVKDVHRLKELLKKSSRRAVESEGTFLAFVDKWKLRQGLTAWENGELRQDEVESLREKLFFLLNYQEAVIHELEEQSGDMSSLLAEFENYVRRRQTIKVAGIIAGAFSCFLPVGRLVKYAAALSKGVKSLRSACFVGVGVPLSSYLLFDSVRTYREMFRLIFSSPEGNLVLNAIYRREGGAEVGGGQVPLVASLDSTQNKILSELLLLPLAAWGSNLKNIWRGLSPAAKSAVLSLRKKTFLRRNSTKGKN